MALQEEVETLRRRSSSSDESSSPNENINISMSMNMDMNININSNHNDNGNDNTQNEQDQDRDLCSESIVSSSASIATATSASANTPENSFFPSGIGTTNSNSNNDKITNSTCISPSLPSNNISVDDVTQTETEMEMEMEMRMEIENEMQIRMQMQMQMESEESPSSEYEGIMMEDELPSNTEETLNTNTNKKTTMKMATQPNSSLDFLNADAATATINSGFGLPESFHKSPEPLTKSALYPPPAAHPGVDHNYHLLRQIREDQVSNDADADDAGDDDDCDGDRDRLHHTPDKPKPYTVTTLNDTGIPSSKASVPLLKHQGRRKKDDTPYFQPYYTSSKCVYWISQRIFQKEDYAVATWIGFFALLNVTCANYVLTPMRDAVALQVGVQNIPKLTLASSVLAFFSSVPIGWLFEAPDPSRRKLWKKMGLTRGETQGTSLALFYRFFALSVISYAIGFTFVDVYLSSNDPNDNNTNRNDNQISRFLQSSNTSGTWIAYILNQLGFGMYVAFFLVVHLMKLHSISLVWGVTTEAMEYEDVAAKKEQQQQPHHFNHDQNENDPSSSSSPVAKKKTRLQRLGMVGFGGTLGGLWGSILASSMANVLHLPGLLLLSAFLLEISAELSIELGRIMQKHWEEQQIFRSCQDLASLDTSMQRSTSLGSMKRIASGNSLYRVASGNSISQSKSVGSLDALDKTIQQQSTATSTTSPNQGTQNINRNGLTQPSSPAQQNTPPVEDDNTFTQRLLRGITTILRSRLLMAIFTYNALFASTSVLLSFQRAELVANRKTTGDTNISDDTAFLANINMASSMAVFAMQASGVGAIIAQKFGPRGSLALMPGIRLLGVLSLAWWHRSSDGQPPNLILFLMLDECTRVVNLAIAKPVRESLWRGLSNEARYEAKPIVDTLANRWGAGSASFCMSVVNKILLWLGMAAANTAEPEIFGYPPVLFLCLIVAVWWTMVSLDLGHIRKRIDLELKKHQ